MLPAAGSRLCRLCPPESKEVRGVIELARRRLLNGEQTVLFIDEVHRFSKTQQDALLAAVENRIVLLVGATTENPSFSVVSALLSRSLVLQLQSLTAADVQELLERAVADERGFGGAITIDDDAMEHLVRLAPATPAEPLTALEAAAGAALDTAGDASGPGGARPRDRRGQCRQGRGSVRPCRRSALRRHQCIHQEHSWIRRRRRLHYLATDADPRAKTLASSHGVWWFTPAKTSAWLIRWRCRLPPAAAQAVQLIGMPEARLALAQATIHLATAPKSGAVIAALGAAMADVAAGKSGLVPPHLRDGHYKGAEQLGNGSRIQVPARHT